MANYQYDGNMAAYFLITFLAIILIPLTLSLSLTPRSEHQTIDSCKCKPCLDQHSRIENRDRGTLLLHRKTGITAVGWILFLFLAYKTAKAKAEHKVYDPFEVLGLKTGVTEKEIKSHYKRLSKIFHPDKVKPTVNQTIEAIANKFVEITKAYKSLTDETIRKNWELYGHPDGRQEAHVGIALPTWVVDAKNNAWVLGCYGLVFGGALPVFVGRWWFGSRQKTKDGVHALTAAAFFKSISEESEMGTVVGTLGRAFEWEGPPAQAVADELADLEKKIKRVEGKKWAEVKSLAGITEKGKLSGVDGRRQALIVLYAHLMRIPIYDPSLQKYQNSILLQTPTLLSSLLTTTSSRNWLAPTIYIMQLHAYLVQAIPPLTHSVPHHRFAQLPGIRVDEVETSIAGHPGELSIEEFVSLLEKRGDDRIKEVKKALSTWGRLELVDASFKVIGERLITPSAIVFLVVKLRISPPVPTRTSAAKETDEKLAAASNDNKDYQFLIGRKEVEDLPQSPGIPTVGGWAHAPYWPAYRKPSWWLVLADDKTNRLVVPPLKVADVPFSDPSSSRNYRSYKLQFQAPSTVGLYTWNVRLISDTFVGEEVSKDLALKVDDVAALNADEQGMEDDISEPDEDSLAGQMAIMRGGNVKRGRDEDSDDDDESSTDDDNKESQSSSESD